MAIQDPLLEELYALVRTGRLSPGERVDQRMISEMLQVSRTPLREALRALAAEGILQHSQNQGYTVAKFSASELLQFYALREFVESELLSTVLWPGPDGVSRIEEMNQRCIEAAEVGATEALGQANQEFHFEIFSWSPQRIMYQEMERIWRVSAPYRAFHLSSPERRAQIGPAHEAIIETVRKQDHAGLVREMHDHRDATRQLFQGMLNVNEPIRPIPV